MSTLPLAQALALALPGCTLEQVEEIDSTNAELMRRARAGARAPVLLVASRQTAGRGRLARPWLSAVGQCLTFSLGLPYAPRDWSGLSLAAGLSLAQALHPKIALKWPNDLWWQGRKLAGILAEVSHWSGDTTAPVSIGARAKPAYLVLGVGLNLERISLPEGAVASAGLREFIPQATALEALALVAPALAQALVAFEQQGFAPQQAHFAARDALAGQALQLSWPDGRSELAQAAGIASDGALLVQTEAGLQRITSAEVSVRPVAQ